MSCLCAVYVPMQFKCSSSSQRPRKVFEFHLLPRLSRPGTAGRAQIWCWASSPCSPSKATRPSLSVTSELEAAWIVLFKSSLKSSPNRDQKRYTSLSHLSLHFSAPSGRIETAVWAQGCSAAVAPSLGRGLTSSCTSDIPWKALFWPKTSLWT